MNLNEVKKHVYFNLAIYIGIGICLILSLFAILITPVKAQEQTTDITNSIRSNFNCPYGYNASGYCAIQTDNGGGVRSFNTRYNGVLNTIAFAFPYYFNQNSNTEIIDIYSTSNDFRNNNINVYCSSYENSPSQSNNSNCSFRFISQKHIQVIFPYDVYQWHEISITSNNAITGVSNYLIQKVTLTYDDGNQDLSGIIDNATSNTTDIINNNNSNAEQTQNVIYRANELIMSVISNQCPNLLDPSNYIIDPQGKLGFKLNLTEGYTYTLTSNVPIYAAKFSVYSFNAGEISGPERWDPNGFTSWTFTTEDSSYNLYLAFSVYNFLDDDLPSNIHLMLTSSSINSDYCPYGTNTSKLDWINAGLTALGYTEEQIKDIQEQQKDLQQQQNDYLMDNSDPTVDSSGIQNTINSVQTTNPLSYLLTLPTNLLSAIINGLSSNSCTDFEIGKFGHIGRHDFGTYIFKFPCINVKEKLGDSVYNTIDIFVSVGILVVTIVKLYSTISNYLTLGAEDEVKSHSHFLTPMDFLGNILGGNISGVGNSISSAAGGGNW